jgi:hypothetical protein
MNPPAQLSTACRAGVNKEVEYFFKMGLRPKPRPAGPPPAAPLQPVVGFGLVMVGLEMVGLGMRSEIAVFRTAERGPCNFPPFRIILRLENAARCAQHVEHQHAVIAGDSAPALGNDKSCLFS